MLLKKIFNHNTADFWLNLLIVVLLGALLAQCAVYLADFTQSGRSDGNIPFAMQMLSPSTQSSRMNIDSDLFRPALIAVHSDGSAAAVLNSAAVISEIYTDVNSCLFDALQNEGVPVSETQWKDAALGENYVYVQYPGEFPYQVVFAFAAADADSDVQIRQADTYIGIRELLLVPDEAGRIVTLLVRGAGGVYSFAAGTDADMGIFSEYPRIYPDVFYTGSMLASGNEVEFSVQDKVSAREIYISEIGASALLVNRDHLEDIFRLLNYNPDKLRYHTEADGAFVYVESHGVLRVDARTVAYSAAEQGGIALSRIVGGESAGDIYTYLRAASHIVWRLAEMDPLYTGGDAKLLLRSVSTDDGAVTLHFSFCTDNTEIYRSDRNTGLTITFKGDKIIRIVHHMTVVRRGLDERKLMLQSWCKDQIAPGQRTAMRPVYRMEEGMISMSAEWFVELVGQKEGGEG